MKNTFLELSHPSQTFRVFLHSSLEKATCTLNKLCSSAGIKKKKKKAQALPARIATEAAFPIGLADRQKQISAVTKHVRFEVSIK